MLQMSLDWQNNPDIGRHFWTQAELKALNLLRSPIWIVDTDRQRICWGNDAILKLWNIQDIKSLKHCDFASQIPSQLHSPFRTQSKSQHQKYHLRSKIIDWTFEGRGYFLCLRCHCLALHATFTKRAILVEGMFPTTEETGKRNNVRPIASNPFARLVKFLQAREKRDRLLVNQATNLISRHVTNGKILAISADCKGLLGYDPEELVGLFPQTIHPRDIALLKKSYLAIAKPLTTSTMTYQMRHKTGHYLQMETTSQMLRDVGKPQEILAISGSVSEAIVDRTTSTDNILARQQQIIESIATDRELEETLILLLQAIEEQLENCQTAIVLLDETGEPILEVRSPGQGQYNHKNWRSTPIIDPRGTILGLFLIEDDLLRVSFSEKARAKEQLIPFATHLAAIAIERKRAGQNLERAEAKYRSIFENSPVGIFQTSPDGHYLNANPVLAQIYGYDSPKNLIAALTDVAHQLYIDPQRRAQFIHLLQQNDIIVNFESRVYCRDGSTIWISENTRAVRDPNGDLLYYEGTVQDITARRQAEEQLRYLALYDDLTQLPNRPCFLKHLEAVLFNNHHSSISLTYAVLFIDLDRFKAINDSLGHWIGDELLKAVTKRLRDNLASRHEIARFGGDEFAVLARGITGVEEAAEIARSLLTKLETPFQVGQEELFVRASIGIVVGNDQYTHPENLLRDADIAMYRAKLQGKGRYEVFAPQMQIHTREKLQLENDLRRGLERGEFCLYYQPIVCLSSGKLRGFESLIRWHHPERGIVSPHEFIALAEENGEIEPLGWFVLETACQQLRQWQEYSADSPHNLQLNVNLSPQQLGQVDFVEKLEDICRNAKIDRSQLKLEITEGCLLKSETPRDRFQQLKALGLGLCIDDFGMGYSSLSRLHEFPIDTIKIDRSFVAVLKEESPSLAIVKTIVTLARGLGMDLVAEGVESLPQIEILKSLGCELAQGYFFSPPIPVETATQWVLKNLQKVEKNEE